MSTYVTHFGLSGAPFSGFAQEPVPLTEFLGSARGFCAVRGVGGPLRLIFALLISRGGHG